MSQFDLCYNFMMDNEDPSRAYACLPDAPPGAYAISGVNSAAWPGPFATIEAIPQAERGPAVEAFYRTNFWDSNPQIENIISNQVAERYYDASVNMGTRPATKLLQQAVNKIAPGSVALDGCLGPLTVAAVNHCDPDALVNSFRAMREAFYRRLVLINPDNQQYLAGWLKRAGE